MSGRTDLYTLVHKGLRAFMADVLVATGRMDPLDDDEVADVASRVGALLTLCRSHLEHEDRVIHTMLEHARPGSTARTAREHEGHLRSFDALAGHLDRLQQAAVAARPAAALDLYRALALFVGDNLAHMHVEETVNNAALWACFRDSDLDAAHRAIVDAIPPQEKALFVHWIVPCVAPAERAAMLAAMQASMPAGLFGQVVDSVRPHLGERNWRKLLAALRSTASGLPALSPELSARRAA